MVYFLGDWGMGDTDCTSCQHVSNISQHNNQGQINNGDHLHPLTANVVNNQHNHHNHHVVDTESDEDEISLHPLNNQVILLFLLLVKFAKLVKLI